MTALILIAAQAQRAEYRPPMEPPLQPTPPPDQPEPIPPPSQPSPVPEPGVPVPEPTIPGPPEEPPSVEPAAVLDGPGAFFASLNRAAFHGNRRCGHIRLGGRGGAVTPLDLFVNLRAVDCNLARSFDAQFDLVAIDGDDDDAYVVANHD